MALSKRCILLIDDNAFLLTCLGDYLKAAGFDVRVARAAEQALEILSYVTPDLIVLDVELPGMGGMAFLARISDRNKPRYPVLVLTAREGIEEFCRRQGVQGFLHKSCGEVELLDCVMDILGRQPAIEVAADEGAEEERRPSGEPPSPPEPAEPPPSGIRVLIAEDEGPKGLHLARLLGEAGLLAEVVTSGPAALETLVRFQPDALLTKEVLPGLNGSKLAAHVRELHAGESIPIVLYDDTRTVSSWTRLHGRNPEGVTEFVPTANAEELVEVLKRRLEV